MDKQYQQEDIQELMSKLLEDVQNISEELSEHINCPSWNRRIFYDDDDDKYTIIYSKPKTITPEEPDNSLSMGDEHLSIFRNSIGTNYNVCVENLVPIPSEFEGISDDTCDVPVGEDSSTFDALSDHSEILSDSNDDGTLSNDVVDFEASNVILREKLLNISRLITNIESLNDNPTPDHVFKSSSSFPIPVTDTMIQKRREVAVPLLMLIKKILYDDPIDDLIFDPGDDIDEIDTFLDVDIPTDIEDGYHDSEGDIHYPEILLSDNTTLSLPSKVFLDHDPRSLSNDLKIMVKIFDPEIHETKFSPTYVSLTFEDRHYLSFTYVIRTFLPYFTYPMIYPFPLSSGSEDIFFDPGISAFHFSLEPVAFKCPMEVCSSTCFIPNFTMIWGVKLVTRKKTSASWEAPHAYP
ncbi:hypothetical protein Tco_0684917 [Tanacetum coccineum]